MPIVEQLRQLDDRALDAYNRWGHRVVRRVVLGLVILVGLTFIAFVIYLRFFFTIF
jgi:hypothetical protein